MRKEYRGIKQLGRLDTLFHELDVKISFELLDHSIDVQLDDCVISIYREKTKWEEELSRVFPERSQDILAFRRNELGGAH